VKLSAAAPLHCLPPPRPSVVVRLGDSICLDVSERALLAGASLRDVALLADGARAGDERATWRPEVA
jgi:hypothetical protein